MQDTCSEVNVPAASHPEPELIISCHRDQRDQCHRNNLQRESKVITRSQSSASTARHAPVHQLKQQQSLPTPLTQQPSHNSHHNPQTPKSVSILVYKTLNTVFKSSRKIIVRVCEVASAKKSFTMFKFNKAAQQQRIDNRNSAVTGHDPFVRPPVPEKKVRNIMKKLHKANGLKRSNSAIEFDVSALTAANRRQIYSRPNIKYQYSALDSGNGIVERSPRERAQREKALNATQEWIQGANGRYEVIAHLDEIGSRHGKNWFLVTDASVRTDRLQTLLPLPPDCVAFEDLPPNECAREILMELLGSLHHPYIYPVLDLGFLRNSSYNYACLVTPFNSRGSLKDLIYKAQWNEPWARKYTRKPNGLPVSQVQRLGRQILEALLFLKERGFPLHGHLHSGNVILQNGAARLSGLENGLLGLSSRINAVMWSRSVTEIENVDIVCFGHLLYEMCTGQELTTPKPSMRVLEMELQHYPQIGQILEILGLIFEPPSGVCPSVEDLVLCDLFRSIDLRELRGPCFSTIKPSLSRSTLNLLQAVKKRQCASLGHSLSEANSPCTPPSTPHDRRTGISRTMDSFDISSDSEEGLLEEIVVGGSCHRQHLLRLQQWHSAHSYVHSYASESPIHYCDPAAVYSDDNSQEPGQDPQPPTIRCSTSSQSNLDVLLAEGAADEVYEEQEEEGFEQEEEASGSSGTQRLQAPACTSSAAGASFNHQLTADMCNYKNSKSRRLEYSLKCLKYGRSNPSQDSAFGSLTDNDLSIGSSSIRLSSFQSISSPIDEGVEDVIIATTTGGNETCLELATIPRSMVSQDSAISSPCRESSPNNFLHIDDAMSGTGSTSSGSNCGSFGNIRPQQFPVSLSPKILVTATSNSSNSSLASSSNAGQGQAQLHGQGHPQQQFDPPKILVNDQNSIYTTSPSKRSGMIEVFSQKYRCPFQVSSFEDMSPKRTSDKQHLKHVNRLAFRSLEEERRIDNAFLPMADRTHSDNRVNMQSEKYKKLTHASFRISKGQGQDSPTATPTSQTSPGQPGNCIEMQRTGRQTLWRDSKFYRKNRIAKSNDSLMENNPSPRISPCSLRDNQYESRSSSQASRRSLSGSQQMLSVTTSFCGNGSASRNSARYCSSKSEDLGESSDYLRVMDARKSYSERHLVRLKQTAINNTHSEDDMSFNDDNNQTVSSQGQGLRQCGIQYNQKEHHQKHYQGGRWSSSCSIGGHLKTTNIKTTSLSAQSSQSNLVATSATASYRTPSKSLDQSIATIAIPSIHATNQNNTAQNSTTKGSSTTSSDSSSSTTSSVDESPSRHTLSGADLSRIFVMDMDDAPGSTCSEEKTPLLDSVEMSPMSPTDPEEPDLDKL
uniref:Slowpoke binding protein, isoform J n=1 Tax=Drosophila melanogaster TaxID=7227 RepID=M9PB66_DROME|nr:slowpoke binding protein, isoform J [Drosophila melanogaster]AGB92748.1 slowpoke binding protein, isoform J [Drosophila melanogaster]|eukprot:NP_001260212.1 slowpoke binding protein, isoform J [Drosophila melanogaster]